jgi:hypothetical protein
VKPESREEAIMQNILGASNVLEPSESNIEEILKSILYNTPYTKEAEFEIEKILLAIKNNGTYDGEGESRDMKILIAILKDLDYTEEAESRIEELFIEWLQQRSQIKVLEGVPPLTFISRGLPLINYLIEGNTTQNGTPTPDNPIMPQGTGERTANLAKYWKAAYVTPNGLVTANQKNGVSYPVKLETGQNVCFSNQQIISGRGFAVFRAFDGTDLTDMIYRVTTDTAYTAAEDCYIVIWGNYDNATNMDETVFNLCRQMLNTGSTALPYEPYGYKIPISCGGTTTPVYLGEVQTTRKIKKLVLTGEEETDFYRKNTTSGDDDSLYYIRFIALSSAPINGSPLYCTHLQNLNYAPLVEVGINVAKSYNVIYFNFGLDVMNAQPSGNTVAGLKEYLAAQYAAGTPVTVWYILAEPETAIVNEPLMKIGTYADSISMEQAGVEIPTASGSNTLDVDTTVKPSNIYIEYK